MAYTQNPNRGTLFKNQNWEEGSKKPRYTGTALIDGKEKRMSAWVTTSGSGITYLSIKFEEPRPQAQPVEASRPAEQCAAPQTEPRAGSPLPEIDDFDEIPF